MGEKLSDKIAAFFGAVVKSYGLRVAVAAVLSFVAALLIRAIFGPGWANFLGAFFVAAGGFLLAVNEDLGKKTAGVWGMASVTFGGVLIMTDAFPNWPPPEA